MVSRKQQPLDVYCMLPLTTLADPDSPGRLLKTLDTETARNRIQEALSEYFRAVRYT